jgi:hypothetical protein
LVITATNFVAGQRKTKKTSSFPQAVKYQAVIDKNEAVFTFPLKPSQKYEFCSRGLQYVWNVAVNSDDQDFVFGFSVSPKWAVSPCGKGDIQKLLRKGQFSLFKREREGNSTSHTLVTGLTEEGFLTYADNVEDPLIETPVVSGFANSNKLTIKLSGTRSLQRLFADQPKYLTFTSQLLEDEKTESVLVTYTARFLSPKTASVDNNSVKK